MQDSKLQIFCEYVPCPLGVDVTPRFSWLYRDERRGARQTAYRITVSSEAAGPNAGDMWDSGTVASGETLNVEYGGRPLASNGKYFYAVTVTTDRDERVASSPAWFRMGLLRREDWKGWWIKTSLLYLCGKHALFRRRLDLGKPVREAVAYIAGLGYYELSINGRRVGDHLLANGHTDYGKTVLYEAYDVKDFLSLGENALGVLLGCGWANRMASDYGWSEDNMRFIFQLEIDYEDGEHQTVSTGIEGWKCLPPGPYIYNSVFHGSEYDATREIAGWDRPGFEEGYDGVIQPPYLIDGPGGELRAAMMEPERVVGVLSPAGITALEGNRYVFDFGQNIAGYCRLRVSGPAGTRITMRYAELVYEDGSLNTETNRGARATDIYTLKGEGTEEFEPKFTYHGFRYMELSGLPYPPREDTAAACIVHNDVAQKGFFRCSDQTLNTMQRVMEWTETNNLHAVPTDCPQRMERMGWLNDMTGRAEQALYNYDLGRLYRKWARDIRDTQGKETGTIYDTAPYGHASKAGGPVDSSFLLVPWLTYLHNNDLRMLEENYDALKRWVGYLTLSASDYIVYNSHMGDWAGPLEGYTDEGQGIRAISVITPGALMSTGYYYYNCTLLAKMASILGNLADCSYYTELGEKIAAAFNRKWFHPDTNQYATGSQGCNTFALYLNLVPKNRERAVLENLVRDILERDTHLTTGNLNSRYIIEVLLRHHREDVAYGLLTQTTYPSWGYMFANGATTFWERWEHVTGGPLMVMASHDHPMNGSACVVFHKYLAGINTDEDQPGFRNIVIKPHLPAALDKVEDTVKTKRGDVISNWRREHGGLVQEIGIPFNCAATVYVPLMEARTVWEGDQLLYRNGEGYQGSGHITVLGTEDGYLKVRLVSGAYAFTSK